MGKNSIFSLGQSRGVAKDLQDLFCNEEVFGCGLYECHCISYAYKDILKFAQFSWR
jgi:hypothetical protein